MNNSADVITLRINALACNIGLLREKLIIYESKNKDSKESIDCRQKLFEQEKEYDQLIKSTKSVF